MNYVWKSLSLNDYRFLSPLQQLLTRSEVDLYIEQECQQVTRKDCEGLITVVGDLEGKRVGVIYSDFRVNGASYGHRNSKRFSSFLSLLQAEGTPAVFVANTTGLSLMAGRKVFSDSFGIWPSILSFSKTNFLVTIAMGKCLGLGPILFGHGHYRMAVRDETHINLTGPEVLKLFFGKRFDFNEHASAERQVKTTDLIHELVQTREFAFEKAKLLINLLNPRYSIPPVDPIDPATPQDESISKMNHLLNQIGKRRIELFPHLHSIVRIFLVERNSKRIGVFINPPGNRSGMITVNSLQKYGAGLDLFKAMGVPVLSMVDAPGIDPRFEQTDRNIIRVMMGLGEKIIHYPHGHMGIAIGRVYGGATTLVFHKNFGGRRSLALFGAKMGSMHESLIDKVLDGSPRLLEEWQSVASKQSSDLKDLIESGNVDQVIEESEIGAEVDRFFVILREETQAKIASDSKTKGARRNREFQWMTGEQVPLFIA
jgi:acetyl-CoA carboxylase carboxyltransferase component